MRKFGGQHFVDNPINSLCGLDG